MTLKRLGPGILLVLVLSGGDVVPRWAMTPSGSVIAETADAYLLVDERGRVTDTVPKREVVVVLLAENGGYRCHGFRHLPG